MTGANLQAPVDTTSGPVVGRPADANGVYAFLGIRYGEAPVGKQRFLPPVPVKKSGQVLHAMKFGTASAQRSEGEEAATFGGFFNEDSLTVNVWTKGLSGARPVMVWIHGGGNTQGSSREPGSDGARLASRGDVVVVSLNYRLGIFGFVDVSVLGDERYRQSAVDGLLDQLEALRWVKQNIAHFGGDPDNVTLFGNSAGAADISALLATPHPEQYFRRAIIQSGFGNTTRSKSVAQRFSRAMFAAAHVHSISQLLAMTPQQLLAMQARALEPLSELESDASFQPTVDGTLIKEFPLEALRHGNARNVDLILGTAANELRLYLLYNPDLKNATPTDMPFLKQLPETKRKALWDTYRASRQDMTDGQVTLDIAGDLLFRAGAIRMAEAQLAYNKNVFMYIFAWHAADPALGAPHAIELPFVFGNESGQSDLLGNLNDPSTKKSVDSVIAAVQQYWTSFARSGVPSAVDGPAWPRYDLESRATMIFDKQVDVVRDPAANERRLFDDLDLNRRDQ